MVDLIGKTISHYRIVEQVGQGGMGVVYKAEDTRLLREVAIKILPSYSKIEDQKQLRFLQEARAASAQNHPNICTIYDIGAENDIHFIVMEYVEGKSLRKILDERKRLPEEEVVSIGIQICKALSAAHSKGIIHRDIKPDNIMITEDAQVKVMDFGLAKLKMNNDDLTADLIVQKSDIYSQTILKTSVSTFLGTAAYMSPEQIRKEEIDDRTDIFSLGIVLYELLTGSLPFEGKNYIEITESILIQTPIPFGLYKIDISNEVENAILTALAKETNERYLHISQLQKVLEKSTEISNVKKDHKNLFVILKL